MLVISAIVASTAIRIEWYNHAVGGFLPRPQPPSLEGNDVKWRASGARVAEWHFRYRLAIERGLELHFLDDKDELFAMKLDPVQQAELDEIKHYARLNSEFRSLVAGMGCVQHLLVPIGLLVSGLNFRRKSISIRAVASVCIAVNLTAAGLMFYREYYLSLGY